MAIKVEILSPKVKDAKGSRGHTFIHFGGDMKRRLHTLAEKCGWTRKMNEFAVLLFEQALTQAEEDYNANHEDK